MPKAKEWREYSEEEILQANIEKYSNDQIIKFYEDMEEPEYSYLEYDVVFAAVLKALGEKLSHPVRAVDMCGGAGKAAFVMKACDNSCQVTLVDVSEKMLEIARHRAERGQLEIDIVQSDAFTFLESEGEYDLIVFSSALHHFKEPLKLLTAAAKRLSDSGMIVTIADPTPLITSRRYRFLKFMLSDRQTKKRILEHLVKGGFSSGNNELAASKEIDVAEYQIYQGIDDFELCRGLTSQGLSPLVHIRYPAGGKLYMTRILPYVGLCWAFSLIITKTSLQDWDGKRNILKKEIKRSMPFRFRYL